MFFSSLFLAGSDSYWPCWLAPSGLTSCTCGRRGTTASETRARRPSSARRRTWITLDREMIFLPLLPPATMPVYRKLIRLNACLYFKTNFAVIQLPKNYGKTLMHYLSTQWVLSNINLVLPELNLAADKRLTCQWSLGNHKLILMLAK